MYTYTHTHIHTYAVTYTRFLSRSEKEELVCAPEARAEYVPAEKKKKEGNEALSNNDLEKAVICYSEAIELCPDIKEYYANRFVPVCVCVCVFICVLTSKSTTLIGLYVCM
jgi:hypothetical protein